MVLYEYECLVCKVKFEVSREEWHKTCPNGHTDNVRRIWSTPPTVIYHGDGFYSTDNRNGRQKKEMAE